MKGFCNVKSLHLFRATDRYFIEMEMALVARTIYCRKYNSISQCFFMPFTDKPFYHFPFKGKHFALQAKKKDVCLLKISKFVCRHVHRERFSFPAQYKYISSVDTFSLRTIFIVVMKHFEILLFQKQLSSKRHDVFN